MGHPSYLATMGGGQHLIRAPVAMATAGWGQRAGGWHWLWGTGPKAPSSTMG